MTRYSRIPSPLPVDTATGAVFVDFGSTRLTRGLHNLWKSLRNRMAARALIDLSDRELADIGLSRGDVHAGFRSATAIDPTIEIACRARSNSRCMQV